MLFTTVLSIFQVDLLKGLTELIVHKQPALLSVRHTRTASS